MHNKYSAKIALLFKLTKKIVDFYTTFAKKNMDFLPTTFEEAQKKGWKSIDVVLVTGDAYIDHPSFGAAVMARLVESQGFNVAVLAQPNWRDDLRDFKKFGVPNLFFAVTAGAMDSMVNHYTAYKRKRSNDAFTPGDVHGFRPDYAATVYSKIIKQLYPESLVILGGLEASLRRFSHYDYWSDTLKPSILMESQADYVVYGMGEKPMLDILNVFKKDLSLEELKKIPQIAYLENRNLFIPENKDIVLNAYQHELQSKTAFAENVIRIEKENHSFSGNRIIQDYGGKILVVNPKFEPLSTEEADSFAALKYMRLPHPKYLKRGDIPAFEMIKNSIQIHRGCFGGCSFCAITAHQGRFITSRSEDSILQEIREVISKPYFKGHISDLGAPTANMYRMGGMDKKRCQSCFKPSCIFPNICPNLNFDHHPLTALYRKVRDIKDIKKVTIGSGVRYDLCLISNPKLDQNYGLSEYLNELIVHHVSGRLKVAPEHTEPGVLKYMRKTDFKLFEKLKQVFESINLKHGLNQQLTPYFIASHPGCEVKDMIGLAEKTKKLGYRLEQVQDFTPTPMTFATALYYLGFNPYTQEKVYCARHEKDRKEQQLCFFWYKKEHVKSFENLKTKTQKGNRKRKGII